MSGIRVDQNILNQKGTPAFNASAYVDRPAAGFVGRIFISTDTKQLFRDTGTAWDLISDAGSGSSNLAQVTLNGNDTPYGINITNGGLFLLGSANGSIFFAGGGSGQFTTDNANFFWDDTNNRLGIGTATPSAKLDVHSSSGTSAILNGTGVSNALLTFQSAGVNKWSVGNFVSSTVADDFNIYDNVNTVSRLQVHNTGVVNIPSTLIIGTTTPTSSYALDVTGSGRLTSTLTLGTLTAGSVLFAGASGVISQNNTNLFWDNTNNRLGIGISPMDTFQVKVALNKNIALRLGANSLPSVSFVNDAVGSYVAGEIDFSTLSLMGGNVLIGTTTDNGDKLQVSANTTITGNLGVGSGSISVIKIFAKGVDTTSGNYALKCNDSTDANLFLVRNDGLINTGTRTNSPYNYSTSGRSAVLDSSGNFGYLVSTRKSKANIESIKNIDFINQLNPVQFNYRKKDNVKNVYTDEIYDNITYGFIADEVEKINKDLTFYNEDGTLGGVEYNSMIAILTKAIQELNKKLVRNNIN